MADASNTTVSVGKAIKAIRAFYATGLKSLDTHPVRMAYGKMEIQAAKTRLNQEMLRKARVFAAPKAGGYTERQLDQLCEQCEKHGFALGISTVVLLISVLRSGLLTT